MSGNQLRVGVVELHYVRLYLHILVYTHPQEQAEVTTCFGTPVQHVASFAQVPASTSLLTALGLLSLLICCSGQWGFASNCSTTIRLDQIFASNVTGNYIGVLEIVSRHRSQALLFLADVVVAHTTHSIQHLSPLLPEGRLWPLMPAGRDLFVSCSHAMCARSRRFVRNGSALPVKGLHIVCMPV